MESTFKTTEEALKAVISSWETFLDGLEYDLDGHYPPNYVSRVDDMEKTINAAKATLKETNMENINESTKVTLTVKQLKRLVNEATVTA